jgi:hypothetical protein
LENFRLNGGEVWNKGLKGIHLSPNTEFKKGRKDDKMYNWKGDSVSYSGVHHWVKRWKGKPTKCEVCGLSSNKAKLQWSNIDHKYKRVLDDYIGMCPKCHYKYDVEVLKSNRSKRNAKQKN